MSEDISYAKYINLKLNDYLASLEVGVFYGQNVISGSRVSGLGAGTETHSKILSINTPNSENSLFGMGFGLSITGIPSIYLMKQHDFGLLAIDHIVNTRKLIQNHSELGSFLAIMVVVDSGFEGPQSNLNNLDDFHSISQADIWLLNSQIAINHAFESKRKDFEIFAISQRTLKSSIRIEEKALTMGGFSITGRKLSIEDDQPVLISCGLATETFDSCVSHLQNAGIDFLVARQIKMSLEENTTLIEKLGKGQRKFVICDSSKSRNKVSTHLALALRNLDSDVLLLERDDVSEWKRVHHDQFEIDAKSVLNYLTRR